MKPPKCSGKRKDGTPCNSYAREDGLCAWHLAKRDEPEPVALEPVVLLPPDPEPEAVAHDESGGIRKTFQDAALASTAEMITELKEVAGLTKPHNVRCKCGLEFAVPVPDGNARVKAIDTLVGLGYGPPPKDSGLTRFPLVVNAADVEYEREQS